jgi:hypothetical protein
MQTIVPEHSDCISGLRFTATTVLDKIHSQKYAYIQVNWLTRATSNTQGSERDGITTLILNPRKGTLTSTSSTPLRWMEPEDKTGVFKERSTPDNSNFKAVQGF